MTTKRAWVALCALTLAGASLTQTASTSAAPAPSTAGGQRDYVVLLDAGASVDTAVRGLKAQGARVTRVNRAIGLVSVTSGDTAFRTDGAAVPGVSGVAANRSIGSVPVRKPVAVEREHVRAARAEVARHPARPARATGKSHGHGHQASTDPLDTYLWGMRMIGADTAHARHQLGSKRVRVGIIDTGVQGDHPDLAPNFDRRLSRNFVTDIPAIDGPCEHPSCVDPVGEDDGGHGTHVAGTVAAALNHFGVSGVAPQADLVEVRAGQDSGYFFLGPVVDALTYSADAGIDVVNMSFYVDPWLYNCVGGAPEDSAAEAQDQDVIIEAMTRAMDYAHDGDVTMVAALGNSHEDISNPRPDFSSPDYGSDAHARTIDNATCFDLPVEGPHVIGVSAVGPSATKADYSNWATDLGSGELEVSAPGGWYRDGFGTDTYRTIENLVLSSVPLISVQETGEVDANGDITPLGEATGVMKQCTAHPTPHAARCGYYAYYQGTSMASPHAAGVAALAVSAHGRWQRGHGGRHGRPGFGMDPDAVRRLLMSTATDQPCPAGGVVDYLDEGRSAEYTATCVGSTDANSLYGDGIVNALAVGRR